MLGCSREAEKWRAELLRRWEQGWDALRGCSKGLQTPYFSRDGVLPQRRRSSALHFCASRSAQQNRCRTLLARRVRYPGRAGSPNLCLTGAQRWEDGTQQYERPGRRRFELAQHLLVQHANRRFSLRWTRGYFVSDDPRGGHGVVAVAVDDDPVGAVLEGLPDGFQRPSSESYTPASPLSAVMLSR